MKAKKIDHWISVNSSLPKIVQGDGCSNEVLIRCFEGEVTGTWDGSRWVDWNGRDLHSVTHWTTEGLATY